MTLCTADITSLLSFRSIAAKISSSWSSRLTPTIVEATKSFCFDHAVASVRRDPSGALHLRPLPHDAGAEGPVSEAGEARFTIEAARVRAPLVDVARWLSEGPLPLDVDPLAPLTLWSQGHALARGRLVRDRGDVGLCVESVRRFEPDTRPY